ncbi:MAG: ester cyclase [Ktedonobacteraceae bacterium]
MSTEENKTIIRRLLEELVNQEKVAVWDELAHPDILVHGVHDLRGSTEAKAFFADLFRAFHPRFTFEDVIAEDETVVVRLIESGTMSGSFMGMPPTGKSYTIGAVQICRLAEGKLAEMWGFRDSGSQMRQLGLLPPPGPASS